METGGPLVCYENDQVVQAGKDSCSGDYGGCNENNQAVFVIVTINMNVGLLIQYFVMDTLVTLVVCMQ